MCDYKCTHNTRIIDNSRVHYMAAHSTNLQTMIAAAAVRVQRLVHLRSSEPPTHAHIPSQRSSPTNYNSYAMHRHSLSLTLTIPVSACERKKDNSPMAIRHNRFSLQNTRRIASSRLLLYRQMARACACARLISTLFLFPLAVSQRGGRHVLHHMHCCSTREIFSAVSAACSSHRRALGPFPCVVFVGLRGRFGCSKLAHVMLKTMLDAYSVV